MTWVEWLAQVDKIIAAWRGQKLFGTRGDGGDCGQLCWDLALDPGKATGLGAVVYLIPPAPEVVEGLEKEGIRETIRRSSKVSRVGHCVDVWSKVLAGIRAEQIPGGLLQSYDATGAVVLTYWAEFLSGEENSIVRKAVSRVRGLGALWYGNPAWEYDPDDQESKSGLGKAGIVCERFTLLRMDKSADFLSPVRVTAAFSYAVEDEFGVRISTSQSSGDAVGEAGAFGPKQLKKLGMWVSGPDHVRDGLGHAMFAIRKSI